MKQIILSHMLVLFLSLQGYTQCKNTKSTDDFDSKISIRTQAFTIMNTPLSFIVGKTPWKVEMHYYTQGDTLGVYLEHSSERLPSLIQYIYFKFSDGTIIKKTDPIEYKRQNGWGGENSVATSFVLTKDELLKFTQVEVQKIKFEFRYFPDYQVVENDVNKNKAKQYMKFAKCLMSEL